MDAPAGDAPAADGNTGPVCVAIGETCGADGDCCLGLRCEGTICRGEGCGGGGERCTLASECCTLNCDNGMCGTDTAPCAVIGEACGEAGDCCSYNCGTDGQCADSPLAECSPVGEACTDGTNCCSRRCAAPDGMTCTGSGDCRCAAAAACRAYNELCTNDAQCCIGLCSRPDGATVGTCAGAGSCGVAGQPCGTEGFSGACCSTACLDAQGTGTATCQPLGGCRVQDEPCTIDGQCCSGTCEMRGTGTDGRPIMRCGNVDDCLPAGELCGVGIGVNCCPGGGGRTGCEPTNTGVHRCLGGGSNCDVLPGETCTTGDTCCPLPTGEVVTCQPRIDENGVPLAETACCLSDGVSCALGDVCCSGVCAPDATGALKCGSQCIASGGACTADADCCMGCCASDGAGGRVCSDDQNVCGACMLGGLGAFCMAHTDCCNAAADGSGPVYCGEGEFRTCTLR